MQGPSGGGGGQCPSSWSPPAPPSLGREHCNYLPGQQTKFLPVLASDTKGCGVLCSSAVPKKAKDTSLVPQDRGRGLEWFCEMKMVSVCCGFQIIKVVWPAVTNNQFAILYAMATCPEDGIFIRNEWSQQFSIIPIDRWMGWNELKTERFPSFSKLLMKAQQSISICEYLALN